MTNMNYCQFENTLGDLRDCYNAEGMVDPYVLSDTERVARDRLIALCLTITNDYTDEGDEQT